MARPIDDFSADNNAEELHIEADVAPEAPVLEASEPVLEPVVEPVVVEAPEPLIEAPAPVVEAPAPVVEAPAPVSDKSGRIVYSTREKNLPNFGLIKKGYSKIETSKAEELVNKYVFIRFASDSEIKDYASHLI